MAFEMKKKLLLLIAAACMATGMRAQEQAKYIFLFIGDGMGFSHVSLAEYYRGYAAGLHGPLPLSFSAFPVLGMASTFSATNLITDSAASGTALATGEKTYNHSIGTAADSAGRLTSIAYKLHDAGFRIGISSTVPLNHATPAAFYASVPDRNCYYDIAVQLALSGFEFFGGGGLMENDTPEENIKPISEAYNTIRKEGYALACGMEEYREKAGNCDRIYLLQEKGTDSGAFPYVIDSPEGSMTHADLVGAGIDFLYEENGSGFFMMSEAGNIDWAAHKKDTKATVLEVLSLSDAVDAALEFYMEHPDETLIVVTADHETGGLSLGRDKGYNIRFSELEDICCSVEMAGEDSEMSEEIEEATCRAHIGWTTRDHTGGNVPVFAIGVGSRLFSGRMDDTDIPKRICEAAGVEF